MSEENVFFDEGDVVDQGEMEREEAFQVPGVRWNDKKLLPFTMARKAFFLSWRTAMGAPSLALCFAGDADAFLADALRLIFLCSQSPEKLEDLRYDLRKMQAACDAWADECVPLVDAMTQREIVVAGLRLWNGTTVTQAVAAVDPDARASVGK